MATVKRPVGNPKRKQALVAALAAAALAVYLPMLWKRPVKKTRAAARLRVEEESQPRASARAEPSGGEPMKPEAGGRRPAPSFEGLFEPGKGAAAAAVPRPRVSSILRFGRERMAVIDGRVVRPGDRVGAHRVEEIGAAAVVLRAGSDTLVAPLGFAEEPPAAGESAARARKP
ncbi:MAG: hypothetical protein ACRD2T_10815 [Thermoanaerobaculia bacterium]